MQYLILTLTLFGLLDQNSASAVGSVVSDSGDYGGDDGNSRFTSIFEKIANTFNWIILFYNKEYACMYVCKIH